MPPPAGVLALSLASIFAVGTSYINFAFSNFPAEFANESSLIHISVGLELSEHGGTIKLSINELAFSHPLSFMPLQEIIEVLGCWPRTP